MKKEKNKEQSQAKRIRELLHVHKGLFKKKQSLTDFNEPILFLIRRDKNIEFYEKATKGEFTFTHSDGKERKIDLIPSQQLAMDYAGRKTRCYWCHEDYPIPLPEDPLVTSEIVAISQEKSMHDINKFRLKEEQIKSGSKIKFVLAIAGLVLAIALAIMLIPESWWDKILPAKEVAQAAPVPVLGMVRRIKTKWLKI